MLIPCVEQKNEEAKGSAVGEETSSLDTIVSEGALAASDVPAAMDASDAESDSGTHKPGLCFGRRRGSKAAQKAARSPFKEPKPRRTKVRCSVLSSAANRWVVQMARLVACMSGWGERVGQGNWGQQFGSVDSGSGVQGWGCACFKEGVTVCPEC